VTRVSFQLTPMRAVTELRAVVDCFAARYAAVRVAAGADKHPLLDAFQQFHGAARRGALPEVVQADLALHGAVIRLADVEGLMDVWKTAFTAMDSFHVDSIRACWPDLNVLFEAHRPIVDAICSGDPALAEDATQGHSDAVWYRLADHDASLPDDPVTRTCTYLDFHLHEPVRLGFLAKYVAKTSPGHLARLFRQRRGMTYTEYLRELRMQKAADLLRQTKLPIRRIASRVGYEDPSRFTVHFRRRFELTPRAFRRQLGAGSSGPS
jgi:AraC-like DNA-binding protein